jgi:NodT family efflux transporter outer membrane factor (OMF) lipoprotein
LVGRAIAANPSIEAAQAALHQVQETVYAQQGLFFPTVQAEYTYVHQQLAGNLGWNSPGIQSYGRVIATKSNPAGNGSPFNGPVVYDFHTAQFTVRYVPDVFGANRRQVESLKALADVQRFELEATYITLASNVVAAALQEASVRARIDAVKKIITVNETSLGILRDQFRFAYVMRIDVAAREAALAAAQALLQPLEKQYEQTRDLIRALVGNLPSEDVPETFELASLHLPDEPPVSLPAKLIEQRPDIRAAEAQLHAANAQVGVAIAAMLPQITLSSSATGL